MGAKAPIIVFIGHHYYQNYQGMKPEWTPVSCLNDSEGLNLWEEVSCGNQVGLVTAAESQSRLPLGIATVVHSGTVP